MSKETRYKLSKAKQQIAISIFSERQRFIEQVQQQMSNFDDALKELLQLVVKDAGLDAAKQYKFVQLEDGTLVIDEIPKPDDGQDDSEEASSE